MKNDYSDFIKLLVLLNAKVSIVKEKYNDLDVGDIKLYELESDINAIERLIDGVAYKKEKIAEIMFDEYVKEYEQEFKNQEKVIAND